jgi:hypothetical protein
MEGLAGDVVAMDVAKSGRAGNGVGGATGKANLGGEDGAIGSINISILEVSPFRHSEVTFSI